VRYSDVQRELSERLHTREAVFDGLTRFVYGLSKKVILANGLGNLAGALKASMEGDLLGGWLWVISYGLQIYFDFSGYSDMAIGLGKVFGFNFPENFEYPYESKSITEFWRRWHISLGSWFRDYVYIPMGGSKKGLTREAVNLMVVWMLTGLWHGAGLNFILWGAYFGLLLLVEKFLLVKVFSYIPDFILHTYTLVLVFISWVIFDGDSMEMVLTGITSLFNFQKVFSNLSMYYLKSYGVMVTISILAATKLPKRLFQASTLRVLEPVYLAFLLLIVTALLSDGTYNPFIYFRF
jgi:alginate O-acetyltransferase complex protein AlgI